MKNHVEIAAGLFLGTLGYLAYLGVDAVSLVVVLGLGAVVFYRLLQPAGYGRAQNIDPSKDEQLLFDDIGGLTTAKQELTEALDFIRLDQDAARMGIRPLKGILLCGPPGTGKTLLARAAASYTDAVFLSVVGSDFVQMYAGVGAERVRQLFSQAQELSKKQGKTRAIVFIDEIDVLGVKRGQHSSHMEYDQTLNQLLFEMDGLTTTMLTRILVIGATNRADLLDAALIRPGRFDRVVKVDLPEREARWHILKLHTRKKPLATCVDLEKLANETAGFSGAHLESLANEAAILAWRAQETLLTQRHFEESIDKVLLGAEMPRQVAKAEMERIAIHELGHAFVSEALQKRSVCHISILSRGSALGYVRQQPQQDMILETEETLRVKMAFLLAGGVAEEMFAGSRSLGTRSDYHAAMQVALNMVAAGMSELGIADENLVPKAQLHAAVQKLIAEGEGVARSILHQHSTRIMVGKDMLLKQEKMCGEELRILLAS
ncbi:MAG: AAA family ATPase [Firmicutes bacterium]|nr:AAA family ATPase [Dethiobacter sp.]MBS3888713.1 AAA family ATPase [Bacillota bacterium]